MFILYNIISNLLKRKDGYFYDKNNKMIKGAIEKDVEIINQVFKSFTLPLESTKSLIQSLEINTSVKKY